MKAVEKTSFELWFNRKPNVNQLKTFGCAVLTHIPKEQRRKLDIKAKELKFVGYAEESKAYRLIDTTTDKITISRDVAFLENIEDDFEILEDDGKIELNLHKVPFEEL